MGGTLARGPPPGNAFAPVVKTPGSRLQVRSLLSVTRIQTTAQTLSLRILRWNQELASGRVRSTLGYGIAAICFGLLEDMLHQFAEFGVHLAARAPNSNLVSDAFSDQPLNRATFGQLVRMLEECDQVLSTERLLSGAELAHLKRLRNMRNDLIHEGTRGHDPPALRRLLLEAHSVTTFRLVDRVSEWQAKGGTA